MPEPTEEPTLEPTAEPNVENPCDKFGITSEACSLHQEESLDELQALPSANPFSETADAVAQFCWLEMLQRQPQLWPRVP